MSDTKRKLEELKHLHNNGLITQSIYDKQCEIILSQSYGEKTKLEPDKSNHNFSIENSTTVLSYSTDSVTYLDNGNLKAGYVLDEKYKIVELIGRGGMGSVYKAKHLLLSKYIAVKIMNSSISNNDISKKRFVREVKMAMEFTHEHALQIREYGESKEGIQYFTMDFSEGIPLNNILKKEGFLEEKRALKIAKQILNGLKSAHKRGIVHRDLKPSNILIENRFGCDHALVLDFGIAKSVSVENATKITSEGCVGTPHYMSPEQAQGEDIDPNSDLFSIGIILYEMIAGRLPFDGSTAIEILMARILKDPLPIRKFRSTVSSEVEDIINKSLKKEKERRYISAEEFIQSIDKFLNSAEISEEFIAKRKNLSVANKTLSEDSSSLKNGLFTAPSLIIRIFIFSFLGIFFAAVLGTLAESIFPRGYKWAGYGYYCLPTLLVLLNFAIYIKFFRKSIFSSTIVIFLLCLFPMYSQHEMNIVETISISLSCLGGFLGGFLGGGVEGYFLNGKIAKVKSLGFLGQVIGFVLSGIFTWLYIYTGGIPSKVNALLILATIAVFGSIFSGGYFGSVIGLKLKNSSSNF